MTAKKKTSLPLNDACSTSEAAAAVAHDIAVCFKNMNWQVVSFFPNTPCRPPIRKPANNKNRK